MKLRIYEKKVERWAVTRKQRVNPSKLRSDDELIAHPYGLTDDLMAEERGVIVLRNGTVTNRYGDGTRGVSKNAQRAAGNAESLFDEEAGEMTEFWIDVEVSNQGSFRMMADSIQRKPVNMLEAALQVMNEALLEDDDLREAEAWKSRDILFQIMGPESITEVDAAGLTRKYKVIGIYTEQGASIDGMPILDGYNGPYFGGMQGGLRVVKYESKKVASKLGGMSEGLDEGKVPRMWAALYGDGALYGASDDSQARNKRYWDFSVSDDETFTIVELERVPDEIAANLIVQGSSAQEYDDGYTAMDAARRYITGVVFSRLETDDIPMMHGLKPNQI